MANLKFQNATYFCRKQVGKIQTAENVRISAKTDISEVLSVGVDNVVNSYEAAEGEVTFYGKTFIRLLYGDGTARIGSNYNADFTAAVQSEEINSSTACCFDVVTVDVKADTNANTATLSILLEITVYAYVQQNTACLTDGEEVFMRKQNVQLLSQAGVSYLPVTVDRQLCATRTISSVLLAESGMCLRDYSLSDGALRISGDAVVRLTYLSEGALVCDALPFRFDAELDGASLPQDSSLRVTVRVKNTKVRLDIADDSVNTEFTAEIAAVVCVENFVRQDFSLVTDAYGGNCDFALQRQTCVCTLPSAQGTERKRLEFDFKTTSPQAAVNVGAVVTKCTAAENYAVAEGIISATVLTPEGATVTELPFSEKVQCNGLTPHCKVFAEASVCDFVVEENKISAELSITVDSFCDKSFSVVTSAEELPFDKLSQSAIEVCLAHKGETVWGLAKSLHMSEKDLLSANPELSDPLREDTRIVVFNKIG